MKVKKYIEIPEEILVALAEGKYVEGSLHRDKDTCRIVFNVYNRKPRKRLRDIIIRYLEHGWVKESAESRRYWARRISMAYSTGKSRLPRRR